MKRRAYLLYKTYFINLDNARLQKALSGESVGGRPSGERLTAQKEKKQLPRGRRKDSVMLR